MRIDIRRVVLLLLWVVLHAQAFAQSGGQPLLWKATSATNIVYLFGTIHVGSKAFYPLHPNVEEAFDRSKVIALEADPTDQVDLAAALAKAGYRPPDRIDNHISAKLANDLRKSLPGMGFPLEAARLMKPYLLSMALSMMELGKLGYEAQYGLDIHFAQRTKHEHKKLMELESMTGQLALFDALSPAVQEAMLQSTLETIRSGAMADDLKELISAWQAGDEAHLLEMVNRDTRDLPPAAKEETKRIFYDSRNQAMAEKIAHILETAQEAHFVAIGAGHLPGDKGIVELLRKMGFAVSRVR